MPFVYLPPELWLYVIQSMCYHCTRDPRQPPVPDHRLHSRLPQCAPLATLARLCRVSKQLRDIATPVLYHCPITTRPELLVRTIFDRRDLIEHILEMHYNMWQNWPLNLALYPVDFRNAYYEKSSVLPNQEYGVIDEPDDEPEDESYNESLKCNTLLNHVKDTVILQQLSYVTAVSLKTVFHPVCMGIEPNVLRKLCFASITSVHKTFFEDDIDYQDARTAKWLHTSAPNMIWMHYFQTKIHRSYDKFTGSPKLTTLEFQDCSISALALPQILVSNPALTTFAYSDSGISWGESLSPRQMQDSLVRCTPRLKKLHIDLGKIDDVPWPQRLCFDQSLAKLTQLIHLSTDHECLREEEGQTLTEYLIKILPASLQYLRIRLDRYMKDELHADKEDDLRQALIAVARLRPAVFPAMEKIVIWDKHSPGTKSYSDWDRVRDAWEPTGVVFEGTAVEGLFGCRSF